MTSSLSQVLDNLIQDRQLVFQFFAFFSRFEYALKRSQFLKKGQRGQAEADWDRYADHLLGRFATASDAVFKDACDYLKRQPPHKQIANAGNIEWKANSKESSESDEKYILRLIRTVRNNLFHGGKYPDPSGPMSEVGRNCKLLESSIEVLKQCLIMTPKVQQMFTELP
jgi:hypothetical protein